MTTEQTLKKCDLLTNPESYSIRAYINKADDFLKNADKHDQVDCAAVMAYQSVVKELGTRYDKDLYISDVLKREAVRVLVTRTNEFYHEITNPEYEPAKAIIGIPSANEFTLYALLRSQFVELTKNPQYIDTLRESD